MLEVLKVRFRERLDELEMKSALLRLTEPVGEDPKALVCWAKLEWKGSSITRGLAFCGLAGQVGGEVHTQFENLVRDVRQLVELGQAKRKFLGVPPDGSIEAEEE
jgi:hypothetical protein